MTRPPNRFCITQSRALLAENQGHSCLTCETGMSCTEKAADIPGALSSTNCTEAVPSTSPRPVCTTIWSAEEPALGSLNCPVGPDRSGHCRLRGGLRRDQRPRAGEFVAIGPVRAVGRRGGIDDTAEIDDGPADHGAQPFDADPSAARHEGGAQFQVAFKHAMLAEVDPGPLQGDAEPQAGGIAPPPRSRP